LYARAFFFVNYLRKKFIIFKSWRWVYKICGLPGFFVAVLLVLTVKQKKRAPEDGDETITASSAVETGFHEIYIDTKMPRL